MSLFRSTLKASNYRRINVCFKSNLSAAEKLEKHMSGARSAESKRKMKQLGLKERLQGEDREGIVKDDLTEFEDSGERFRKVYLYPEQTKKKLDRRVILADIHGKHMLAPRWRRMSVDQDWPSVWPSVNSYKHSVVPLPIRMGYQKRPDRNPPPAAYGNMELMKIPNFLHLTPPAIKRHCQAIKQFCTPWPENLTDERCDSEFPLTFLESDYVHAGPSIRDPRARIVTLKVKLGSLKLNRRAKEKLIRLVGTRYNSKSDVVTIITDRCPTRAQNRQYAMYLLTALFHESWKFEPWESEISEYDLITRDWDDSKGQERTIEIIQMSQTKKPCQEPISESDKEKIKSKEEVYNFGKAWFNLRNNDETNELIKQYAVEARKLFGLAELEINNN